ncbi:hypothetical protein [Archangium sp.]|uniref:hypothetical protein n=1 Tax=Archangium sp. TaxID=1872627 RepID=UPI002D24A2CD|nr:hypothetical protein [Archangium sp.]HYO54511.1 hypothetical protein [Archangium sp.]
MKRVLLALLVLGVLAVAAAGGWSSSAPGNFLGFISAVLGGTVGVSKRQRIHAEGAVVTTPPQGGLPPTRREVYP